MSMDLLPEEILNEILTAVDRPSLYSASQVCVQWRQFSLKQVKVVIKVQEFQEVCRQGDLLSIMRSEVSNWNWGLRGACQGGHKELVEVFIAKGAKDWNW